ncbi:MAG: tetrahydrofolate dehydrogenase/cyclohydrolase catalytic domain-containing protein [Candidatus Paceibacterota bacterium]
MNTKIIDGYQLAEQHRLALIPRVKELLAQGKKPSVAAILFVEDSGSVLYTNLKREMAESLGIDYQVFSYSINDSVRQIVDKVKELGRDPQITGIIVQKPWRNLWITTRKLELEQGKREFSAWWTALVSAINPTKDVDGLHPSTLTAIQTGDWQTKGKVLPATCRAVIELAKEAFSTTDLFTHLQNQQFKTVILGKSDLLSQPLFALLKSKKLSVEMIGSQELSKRIEQKVFLKDADLIISATGRRKLVTDELIKTGAVIIDVGEPQGDVDLASVLDKSSAVTPVPGGVGPMTVICLLENTIELLDML